MTAPFRRRSRIGDWCDHDRGRRRGGSQGPRGRPSMATRCAAGREGSGMIATKAHAAAFLLSPITVGNPCIQPRYSPRRNWVSRSCASAINSARSTPNLRACTIGFSQSMCLRYACIISQHDTSRHLIARAARTAHERLHPIVVISPHLSRRHCSPHSGREHSFAGNFPNCSGLPSTAVVYANHHDFP